MSDQFVPATVSDDDTHRFAMLAAHASYYWQVLREDWKIPEALAHDLVRDWHQALLDSVGEE